MLTKKTRVSIAVAAACILFSMAAQGAVVTKITDTNDGVCNADCSLREAIAVAAPGEMVSFSALFSAPQIITLTLGELSITKNLVLSGPGVRLLTISGNNAARVISVGGAAGTTVHIWTLTIANGNNADGAGILVGSGATLFLNRMTVRNNTGVSGGGIFNNGTLNIHNSTISANHGTVQSGGLRNVGTATIINSTFSGNTSANNGGAITDLGQTNLINTTISRNTGNVAGGFFKASGGPANIRNTIIAGNISGNGDPRNEVFGAFTSQGNNLIGNSAGSTGMTNGVNGDILGTASAPVNPMLGPLTRNSGDADTMAPFYLSPALDAGNSCVTTASCGAVNNPTNPLTSDQRLFTRSAGAGVDIGALEVTYITVTSSADAGGGSLRQAVTIAPGSIITIAPTDNGCLNGVCTITLTSGLAPSGTFSILGSGARTTIIQRSPAVGTPNFRIFTFSQGPSAYLHGLNLRNGRSEVGGAIAVGIGSEVHLDAVTVRDNLSFEGGGIYNGGILTVNESTIHHNTASAAAALTPDQLALGIQYYGGGINNNGKLYVRNSTISNNSAAALGGGIYTSELPTASASFNNVTIARNLAGSGGGLYGDSLTTIELRNTIVAGNGSNVTGNGSDVNGLMTSRGNNLIGINNGSAAAFPAGNPNANGDRVGTASSPVDPLLGALANNGGQTDTSRLLPRSPARNTGHNCVVTRNCTTNNPPVALTTDQRGPGFPRQNRTVDIGAYEAGSDAQFDFDGDGKTDIGIFRGPVAEWWINRSSTGVTFALQFGAPTDRIVPADYTGDGKTDIAFFRPSTGEWYVLRSENLSFFSFPFGSNGDIPAPADYDGDGKADPAVFRPATGTWFIQRSSDNGTTIQQFGSNGDQPVAADYDGDGRADLAIYRPSNGQWWLNRSTAGIIAMAFGIATDKTVQGDYTGDGKADVAFWRPSTGEWYILRSENLSYYSGPFGSASDVPAPGDYDGDGKFDLTVFRPSAATWFIHRTTAGILIQQFGANGDRPVASAFVP